MSPVTFAHSLTIDGQVYQARREAPLQRSASVAYLPQVRDQQAGAQLAPVNIITWHRGSLASRPVMPGMVAWSRNGWTCDPGVLLPGPLVTTVALPTAPNGDITAFAEQGGDLLVFSGRRTYRLAAGSGAPTDEHDQGATFVTLGARLFGVTLYVAGTGGNLWSRSAAGTWAQSADTARRRLGSVFWTLGGVTAERLIGQTNDADVQYVAAGSDPLVAANWSPATPIGVGAYPITSLVQTRDHVYLATTGGLRDLDSSGLAPNLTPQVEALVLASNGVASLADRGWIYYGAGYGLLRIRVANTTEYARVEDVTPGIGLPNETPVSGIPVAITRYGNWIILAQWDSNAGVGGTTYISWGRDAIGNEVGPMVWNSSPIVLEGLKVTALHVSGLIANEPRLWIGAVDSTSIRSLRWAYLPIQTPYQDLIQGRAYRFAPTFDAYQSYEDWGDDAMSKIVPEIVAEGENLGVGTSYAVSTAVDGERTYESLGTLNSSPAASLTPITELRGQRLQVKLTGTGTATSPPILRKLSLRAIGRPDVREVRRYQVLVGEQVRHQGGARDGVNSRTRKEHLARLQSGGTISVRDEAGQAFQALMMGGISFTEAEVDASGQAGRYLAATIELAVMKTYAPSFAYDSGVAWDSGRGWN